MYYSVPVVTNGLRYLFWFACPGFDQEVADKSCEVKFLEEANFDTMNIELVFSQAVFACVGIVYAHAVV